MADRASSAISICLYFPAILPRAKSCFSVSNAYVISAIFLAAAIIYSCEKYIPFILPLFAAMLQSSSWLCRSTVHNLSTRISRNRNMTFGGRSMMKNPVVGLTRHIFYIVTTFREVQGTTFLIFRMHDKKQTNKRYCDKLKRFGGTQASARHFL